jgi:hypothetical protein
MTRPAANIVEECKTLQSSLFCYRRQYDKINVISHSQVGLFQTETVIANLKKVGKVTALFKFHRLYFLLGLYVCICM